MITETETAIDRATAVQNPLGLKKIHHVEFYVGNAKQAEFYYRKAFGFSRHAYRGLETGNRDVTSYVMRQTNINFVLTTPLSPDHPAAEHIKQHGDGVRDIAFYVEDADHAFNEAVRRGARPITEPHDLADENGSVRHAAIATYGDTIHSLISYNTNNGHNYNGVFLPGFAEQAVAGEPTGIMMVDHIVGNVELGKMNEWCDFYRDVMGFHRYITFDDNDISTEYSALMSIVMSDGQHNIKFPINEPAQGKGGKSQIQEYIDFYGSAGAQHIALLCRDIRKTVTELMENGVEFLTIPDTYYDDLLDRVGPIDEDIESLKKLGILVDRDDEGYLLQIFTKPVEDRPTVFYEILQRKGCKGFGKGNFKALFVSIEEEQRRRGNL
ncbi:MAG: 4-hydroxyphenylpyruvate dioxygenase [Acidobacteria bacterium]|nr:4-hydroxyphenylpyruvate dioxygenase [Ignavibacteria bacterium]MBK9529295.1 4-hydroxyphenylpyruvate dioxygenase [Acidobacteriota bacterium]MBP7475072.1 4-hydroxyphenylpyruvate dioxygenase [Pyrinomonadaceae bacterium]MBP9109793.1 4-hydroxyphenylpyruvate dioxygenase [Pyrinomonadaceae bacterium]